MDVLDFLGKSVVIEWSFTLWLFNIAMKNVLRTVIFDSYFEWSKRIM